VFVGGFTLEAAEAVSAATGTRGIDPLDGIESLANKSLLMREEREGRVTRLRMLEAIRSFGLERLEEGPDAGKTRRAHAEYFLTFSESAELQGRHQKAWLERIDADYENLRGAMEWFDAEGDRELLARVAVSLVPFWEIRCNLTDGETWLSKALSGARDMPKALIARLDEGGGILARQRGDYERSSRLIEESRTIFEQIGDANGLARAAANLGKTFYRMDALGKMRENNIDAMRMAQKIDDLPLAAVSGMGLGLVDWREGSIEHARERFEECRRIFREHGYRREEAQAINNLGAIQYQRRSYASAAEYFREAMTIQEEIGDLDDLRNVYNNLADVHCQIGDYARSGAYYEKLLDLATSHRDLRGASNAYSGLAEVHLVLGNAVEARRHARLALDAALQAGPGVELGVAYRVLGDIALSFGEIQEAERNYRLGIPLLENASELSEKDKACCGYEYALEILRGTSFQSHV
jgi:tetratricopeptide (TPR) repeat protein